jgi:hypothetical protein
MGDVREEREVYTQGYLSTYNKVPDEIVQQGEWSAARSAQRGARSVKASLEPGACRAERSAVRGLGTR